MTKYTTDLAGPGGFLSDAGDHPPESRGMPGPEFRSLRTADLYGVETFCAPQPTATIMSDCCSVESLLAAGAADVAASAAAREAAEEPPDEEPPPDGWVAKLLNPPTAETQDFSGFMSWYARLIATQRKLEADIKAIKNRIEECEPFILEQFTANDIQRQTVGGYTFFRKPVVFVNKKSQKDGVTTEMVCDALRACGMDYMVGDDYSASSLKSKVTEMLKEGTEIPEELLKVLNITKSEELVARKA